eukprot:scaffold88385_cov48-Phaeocystis_antarctica.AAC.1
MLRRARLPQTLIIPLTTGGRPTGAQTTEHTARSGSRATRASRAGGRRGTRDVGPDEPPGDGTPGGVYCLHGLSLKDNDEDGCMAGAWGLWRGKCGQCEGGCDYDYDCRSGLKCFQRDGMAPVPGCMGAGKKRLDYCIGLLLRIACAAWVPAREDRFPEQHRLERARVAAEGAMEEAQTRSTPCRQGLRPLRPKIGAARRKVVLCVQIEL